MAATRWGVQRQVCLAYSQAWWWECHGLVCMSAVSTGELQYVEGTMNGNMYCDILKQSMIASLRRLSRRAVFQHNDPKHTSKTTTALLKKLRVKVILKRKVEERKVSNIHQLRDVVMEEWKRTPVATCEALVNSMPKRVKAVLENNGGHTKYWHFWPNLDIFTQGCTHFCGQWFRH